MMRNLKARLQKLEAKKPPVKRVVRIYWADGTFVGEMRYQQMNLWGRMWERNYTASIKSLFNRYN